MNDRPYIVAVSGGIGSGKSVVSRILEILGYKVYDCDRNAKQIMDSDKAMVSAVGRLFGEETVNNGKIDRGKLSSIVFSDADALKTLNELVHGSVRQHFQVWTESLIKEPILFVETAILYQSNFDRLVDEVWVVNAPERLKIERVMNRNGLSYDQVRERIKAQEFCPVTPHHRIKEILNDGIVPVLPHVEKLLFDLRSK